MTPDWSEGHAHLDSQSSTCRLFTGALTLFLSTLATSKHANHLSNRYPNGVLHKFNRKISHLGEAPVHREKRTLTDTYMEETSQKRDVHGAYESTTHPQRTVGLQCPLPLRTITPTAVKWEGRK